jgi:heme-degrading monooxygenase HmoA
MIARTWHATATPDGAKQYEVHFRDAVLPALRSLRGFERAYLMQRMAKGIVEIEVLTIWASYEAVADFAGTSVDTAVVEPEAQALLLHHDTTVRHYDLCEFDR